MYKYDTGTFRYVKSAITYINNACDKIGTLFETNIINYCYTFLYGCHIELGTSQLLVNDDIYKYRMLNGCLNWSVTLGRSDVQYASSAVGKYHISPKQVHL